MEWVIARLAPRLDAIGHGITDDVVELGPGRTPEVLRRWIARGSRSAPGFDVVVGVKPEHAAPARIDRYDGRTLPLRNASDLIFSKSVLEHVRGTNVRPLVREMRRVLRPSGGMVHCIDLRDHMHIEGDEQVRAATAWMPVALTPAGDR